MMLYSAAAALLLLNHRATAFQCGAPINNAINNARGASAHSNHHHQILFSATLDSIPLLESILEDGDGHINSALASAIYEWETAHTQTAPGSIKKEFSTRDGLRLVDELAREVLDSLESNSDENDGKKIDNIIQRPSPRGYDCPTTCHVHLHKLHITRNKEQIHHLL
mmetsp:Transcript_16439/g.24421  ORF Transcript_16439/g.24421 Transcript_16439/m.24421 type:complete len:167 (-) Transcript_16439:976-1476(-)